MLTSSTAITHYNELGFRLRQIITKSLFTVLALFNILTILMFYSF